MKLIRSMISIVPSSSFLGSVHRPKIDQSAVSSQTKTLSKYDITKTLKECSNNTSGPDGVEYKPFKSCWSVYANILLDSWNHGLDTGTLAPPL
jgi:hypothetical protein